MNSLGSKIAIGTLAFAGVFSCSTDDPAPSNAVEALVDGGLSESSTDKPRGDRDANAPIDASVDANNNTDAGNTTDAGTRDASTRAPAWVTYLGGSDTDQARDVAVDSQGNVIVVGGTRSPDFPTTAGAYDRTFNNSAGGMLGNGGAMDVFVAKFSPSGSLLWGTYIGGPGYDRAYAVEVDAADNIYVAGRAGAGFPTTAGVVQPAFGGDVVPNPLYGSQDGFISKLSKDGTSLLWSTYFGASGRDFIRDLDVDGTGVYVGVAAVSTSHPFVTAGAFDQSLNGDYDVVAAKVSLQGTAVLWGTYLGGSGDDGAPAVRVGSTGELFVVSASDSTNLPVSANAVQKTSGGGFDLSVSKLSANGSSLVYATYLGGAGNETHETHQLAVNAAGEAIVATPSASAGLTTTAGAISATRQGALDAYIARLSTGGNAILAATYLGGTSTDAVQGVAVDAAGRIYVGGPCNSTNLPTTANAYMATPGAGTNAYVARLSPNLSALDYLTYLGGAGDDEQRSLWIGQGSVISIGTTDSRNFPISTGAFQSAYKGGVADGYVAYLPLP